MWMEPGQGRWVCPRCFESNGAIADRCVKCGLERGADPTATASSPVAPASEPGAQGAQPSAGPSPSPWAAPPAPEPQRPGWLRLALRFWWVGLLVVVGGVAAVNYLGGSRPITEIAVGDCFDIDDAQAEFVDDVTKRECSEPHGYEMFFVGDLPDGSLPSESEVQAWVDTNCLPAFTEYVGPGYADLGLTASYVSPADDAWNSGDHSVQCALSDVEGALLDRSMKDAAR